MSERITEKVLADTLLYAGDDGTWGYEITALVAEVRRLRALIVLAVEEGEDIHGNLPPFIEAEYKAIRAEEGKQA